MKHLIFTLMLTVITAGAKAQTGNSIDTIRGINDTVPFAVINGRFVYGFQSAPFVSHTGDYAIKRPPVTDTIPVIMLATDTVTLMAFQYNGFEVRQWHSGIEGMIDPYFYIDKKYPDYYTHITYLTSERKPIPGNIIIWLSKIN